MLTGYFYNETLKRVITVFGSMFNNIYIARKDGDRVTNTMRVPIAYGPQKKFIARLETNTLEDKAIALKLPRLSFEITSLTYDTSAKLNKLNKILAGDAEAGFTSTFQSVPYEIGMTLSIYGNTQDDMFQILEQILPTFAPQYTVSIKGMEGADVITDVPFTLTSVNLQDDYEGPMESRRAMIYTLDFSIRGRFGGKTLDVGVIKTTDANMIDFAASPNADTDGRGAITLNFYEHLMDDAAWVSDRIIIQDEDEANSDDSPPGEDPTVTIINYPES